MSVSGAGHRERHRIPDSIHTGITIRGEAVRKDGGGDRQAGIAETVWTADTNHRSGICGHTVLQGDASVYGAGLGESEDPMENILHSA
jgi:hypothetical protein